ncbi:MAG: RNA polymerase sigma-70 factor [Parabacteroides sp.]
MSSKQQTTDVDAILWRIAVQDDEQAFRYLFEHYYASLCLFAKRFIDDLSVREDIVQEIFVHLWEKRKSISVQVSAENYLITCVKNESLNYLRRQEMIQAYQERLLNEPEKFMEEDRLYLLQELESLMAQTLAKLPPEYRVAFEMNRMEHRSLEEVAQRMDVSVRTVERYRNRALEILKKELKDYLPLFLMLVN